MAMDLRDYFRLRCSEMLVMERDIWQMNNIMIRETQNPRLKEMFQQHSEPTRHQISNLEQVVDRLGGMIGPEENPVTQGMMRAHRMFMESTPPQEIVDIHHALLGDKTEHMEMAAYNGLIALARQLDENEVVGMLQQNLQEEQQMCSMLEGGLPDLLNQAQQRRRAA